MIIMDDFEIKALLSLYKEDLLTEEGMSLFAFIFLLFSILEQKKDIICIYINLSIILYLFVVYFFIKNQLGSLIINLT